MFQAMMRPTTAKAGQRRQIEHRNGSPHDTSRALEVVTDNMKIATHGSSGATTNHTGIVDQNSDKYPDCLRRIGDTPKPTDLPRNESMEGQGYTLKCRNSTQHENVREDRIGMNDEDRDLVILLKIRFCPFARITYGLVWAGLAFCCTTLVFNFAEVTDSIIQVSSLPTL